MWRRVRIAPLLLLASASLACSSGEPAQTTEPGAAPKALGFEVNARHPHDASAFTQGLELEGSVLYESTGLRGRSTLREVDMATGRVLRQVDLADRYFGEGLAAHDGRLVQLTWQEGTALVYDASNFELVDEMTYATEGWGLCFDGTDMVMSDGTDVLRMRDPRTFAERRSVMVSLDGRPLDALNELECVDGLVWANVLREDTIVAIDPTDGEVVGTVDASSLRDELPTGSGAGVLNGVAHDPETGRFLLTGKNWPLLFEVTFDPL